MRWIYFILAIIIVFLFTVDSVLADDCEDLNEQKICWDDRCQYNTELDKPPDNIRRISDRGQGF